MGMITQFRQAGHFRPTSLLVGPGILMSADRTNTPAISPIVNWASGTGAEILTLTKNLDQGEVNLIICYFRNNGILGLDMMDQTL